MSIFYKEIKLEIENEMIIYLYQHLFEQNFLYLSKY